ncbi:hypothetical protein [Mesorhizobium cantuariense]|uniref:Uncharacterized protein n=1 Tax=Mesorhizobium cantuariense TaxID=1300275 RepID=A0ABV7MJE2_9HYPH
MVRALDLANEVDTAFDRKGHRVLFAREDLYEQVWATPINYLAEKFGVSGSYLARVCEALNVPRPPVGYWQKKAVGKAKPRPELPTALPGDQLSWSRDKPIAVPVKTASDESEMARP